MTDLRLRPHPRLALLLLSLAGLAAVLSACGGGPQCVVDTHCKIDERCVERRCVAVGPLDAGLDGSLDGSLDGGPRDSGGGDSGPRDSGSLDAGPPPTGQVMAFSDQADVGAGSVPRTLVTAVFSESPAGDCTTRSVGGCTLTQCPDTSPPMVDGGVDAGPTLDAGPVDAGPPAVAPNAGVIVVTAGGPTATLSPLADGSYEPFSAASLLWADGSATVSFQAFGTSPGVPGFTQSVPAPTSVTLTSPDLSAGSATLTRLSGVDLAWMGTTAGVVTVLIGQSEPAPSTASLTLRCDLDAAPGSGSVPAIALTAFGPGSATLNVASASQATASGTDPWVVDVAAVAMAILADGRAASVGITLE